MDKGTILPPEAIRMNDPVTGRRTTLWTNGGVADFGFYFHQHAFSPDGSRLYFTSLRGGKLDLWALLLPEGRMLRMTDCAAFSRWADPTASPTSELVYFRDGPSVRRIHGQTLVEDEIARVPPDWIVYQWQVDADDRHLVCCATCDGPPGLDMDDANIDQVWRTLSLPHFENCVFRIEVASGAMEILYRERHWITHAQPCPQNPDLLFFCHEGELGRGDPRMWMLWRPGGVAAMPPAGALGGPAPGVCADGWTARAVPCPDGWLACHEWFAPDRAALCFDAFQPQTGRRALGCYSPVDGETRLHLRAQDSPERHLQSSSRGTYFIGEGHWPRNPCLSRLDIAADGGLTRTPLSSLGGTCHKPTRTEPNAHTPPDEREVFFQWADGPSGALPRLVSVQLP